MTCIVGIAEKDRVIIGGDCAGVSSLDIDYRKDSKVFKLQKDIVIGFTSSFRMGQIIRYHLELDKPPKENIHAWMVKTFIPELRKMLTKHGYAQNNNGEERGGLFLVGVYNELFSVQEDFQVGQNMYEYDSVGCGYKYAKGVLHYTSENENSVDRIGAALRAAAFHSAGVSPPWTIATTKD